MEATIVNVVGAGRLNTEFDLGKIANDIAATTARYDPNKHPGVHIRLQNNGPMITLYRNGKYHITGSSSVKHLNETRREFIASLENLNMPSDFGNDPFSVDNVVCTATYSNPIDLNRLSVRLGLENIEYEPEQFPALIYRHPGLSPVVLIFSSGKLVITGAVDIEEAQTACDEIEPELQDMTNDQD
jgi:transcription initiation factor TFIID TATA-box-binding protein